MSNKVITAISSLVENVILDPSDVVCIDTENNVIGIGTSNPKSLLQIGDASSLTNWGSNNFTEIY